VTAALAVVAEAAMAAARAADAAHRIAMRGERISEATLAGARVRARR